jgi:hypothetical protein
MAVVSNNKKPFLGSHNIPCIKEANKQGDNALNKIIAVGDYVEPGYLHDPVSHCAGDIRPERMDSPDKKSCCSFWRSNYPLKRSKTS